MILKAAFAGLLNLAVATWAQVATVPEPLRMNDILSVGTHNSYKRAIPAPELALIRATGGARAADAIDYSHGPLAEQLDAGARTLELDVNRDPDGGLYADPLVPRLAGASAAFADDPVWATPGLKVMHIADIDPRSQCVAFVACLRDIRSWSRAHPGHAPILILVNAKDDPRPVPGTVKQPWFDIAAFDALDAEIASVFARDEMITPDDVRSDRATLRDAVTTDGWPTLDRARGKVFFALDESPTKVELYRGGRRTLEGRMMFVNGNESADDAAYLTLNDPVADGPRIRAAVAAGLIVRTRADADTIEARTGDTGRRDAALASGAQYVSTDYMAADPRLGDYRVGLPQAVAVVCNPVRVIGPCPMRDLDLEPER